MNKLGLHEITEESEGSTNYYKDYEVFAITAVPQFNKKLLEDDY